MAELTENNLIALCGLLVLDPSSQLTVPNAKADTDDSVGHTLNVQLWFMLSQLRKHAFKVLQFCSNEVPPTTEMAGVLRDAPPLTPCKDYESVAALSLDERWFSLLACLHGVRKSFAMVHRHRIRNKKQYSKKDMRALIAAEEKCKHLLATYTNLNMSLDDPSQTLLPTAIEKLQLSAASQRFGGSDAAAAIRDMHSDERFELGFFVGDPRAKQDHRFVVEAYQMYLPRRLR